MARGIAIVALGVTGWLALSALGGCNEVLDIEQAQPRASGAAGKGSAGNTSITPPQVIAKASCDTPLSACSSCIKRECPSAKQACLNNSGCRYAVDQYRSCLGSQCKDVEEQCAEQLGTATGTDPFTNCAANTCGVECANSPLATSCEIYCSCMSNNCAGMLDATTCVDDCTKHIALADVTCRLLHCVIAEKHTPALHCQHAIGMGGLCMDGTSAGSDCGKRPHNWACEAGDDCCSAECADNNLCK